MQFSGRENRDATGVNDCNAFSLSRTKCVPGIYKSTYERTEPRGCMLVREYKILEIKRDKKAIRYTYDGWARGKSQS